MSMNYTTSTIVISVSHRVAAGDFHIPLKASRPDTPMSAVAPMDRGSRCAE